MHVRRLTACAILSAVALTIFVLEAQIPVPLPVPGLKLGLSNVVTVFALAVLGWREALAIVLVRILLGNLATGQASAILYALAGGLLSFAAMALLRRVLKPGQLWLCGVCGGLMHTIGPMAVAVAITRTAGLLLYLPVLLLCGVATGALTGVSGQLLAKRVPSDRGDANL